MSMQNKQFWKWSIGEAYYKSARKQNTNKNKNKQDTSEEYEFDSQMNAINISLNNNESSSISNFDNNCDNELINITNSMFSRNQNSLSTRREDLDTKMSDRDKIAQRGINPFLQNSYVNDVVTRDMFLKPVNTTQGMHKISETN
jgi:hypothetical protein